jgi:single-stranded-DNA-specific exonuclease
LEEKEVMFLAFVDGMRPLPSTKRGAKPGDIEYAGEQMARLATNAKSRQLRLIESAMSILEGRIQEYALDSNKLLVVFVKDEDNFDSNITGLIAMKLTAKYGKPTILVKLGDGDIYKGSARGLNDSDLPDLKKFFVDSGFFEYAEGHANAHGVGIRKDKIQNFIAFANQVLEDVKFNEKVYMVDYIFDSNEPDISNLILSIGSTDIWGIGVEMPLIVVEKIKLHRKDITLMKNDSMKFTHNDVTYTIFKNPRACMDFTEFDVIEVDVCGKANVNEWAGRTIPQLFISDYNIRDLRSVF